MGDAFEGEGCRIIDATGRWIVPRINRHSIPVKNSKRPKSQEANHAGKVRKATRGRESALQRKQEVVRNEGGEIIRYWVQELLHCWPGGEKNTPFSK